ncbi:MAG: PilT/PilU family type 4a pilus ATPase [Verrucomicrobiota bacterium]
MAPPLDALLKALVASQANDIFLRAGNRPRIRIAGELRSTEDSMISREDLAALWQFCGGDPLEENERDAHLVLSDGERLRVNFFRTLNQLAAVLRPIARTVPSMRRLGLPEKLLETWLTHPAGLVLVTGATSSGKSTTLAACLDWINDQQARHIVTIEDPIEYLFESRKSLFSQREIATDTENFGSALRAALRQNPDVLFVGEIRDDETAETALRAAETGHLVLSTLHSSDVGETIERFASLFVADRRETALSLLSRQLLGVLSQKLVPRQGGGLQLVTEALSNEAATRKWIREGNHAQLIDFLRSDRSEGHSFLESLVEHVRKGRLEKDLARRVAPNAAEFDRALRGIS